MKGIIMSDEEEQWKRIEDFPSYYISSIGRVYSKKSNRLLKVRYVSQIPSGSVNLTNRNKHIISVPYRIDRLVAQAFVPNPENRPSIRHKDGNIKNNRWDNLEWSNKGKKIQPKTRKYHYELVGTQGKTLKFHTLIEVHDFLGLSVKTNAAFSNLSIAAKNRFYKLKRITEKNIHKDPAKRNEFHARTLAFSEYIAEKYPGDTPINKKDPVVIEHYRFLKEWNQ